MADKSELAKQATFLVSKVSKDVYGVDTMTGNLEAGRFKIGAGATEKKIGGRITPGTKLGGMVPIISDNHLLLHDKTLYGDHGSRKWKEWYTKYAGISSRIRTSTARARRRTRTARWRRGGGRTTSSSGEREDSGSERAACRGG